MPIALGLSIVALTIAATRRWRRHDTIDLEAIVLIAASLMCVVGMLAVGLGVAGALTPGWLALLLGVAAVALAPWRGAAVQHRALDRRRLAWTLGLLIGAAALRWPAMDHALAGRDQGTYVLRAAATARAGSFDLVDPIVRDATTAEPRPGAADVAGLYPRRGEAWREDLYESGYRPGWYLADRERGLVVPQFLHLFPALCTVAFWLGGDAGPGWLVLLQGVLTIASVLALARRILPAQASDVWAALAAVAFALSPLAIWVHRNTLTETLTGLLTAAAALGFARAREREGTAMLAAVLLGATAWVRGNAWITAPVVLATLWLLPQTPGRSRASAAFLAVLGIGVAVHAATVFPYLHDELSRQFTAWGDPSGAAIVVAFAIGALAWWSADELVFGPRSPHGRAIAARIRPLLPWILAGAEAAALATWAVRAARGPTPPWSRLDALIPGVGPALLVLAAIGLVLAVPRWVRRTNDAADVWLLAIAALVVATTWAYASRNLPKFGLYYYGRYLVPELLPAACLLGSSGLAIVHARVARSRPRLAIAISGTAALALLASIAWPLVVTPATRLREYDGARRIVDALAVRVPADAIVVAGGEGWHHGHTFNQVAGALAMRYGRSIVPYVSREAAYATLHELLITGPAARGEADPPRVFLLVNEATHALASSVRGRPVAALDDGLSPPFVATSLVGFELVTDRLTPINDGLPTAVTRDALRMVLIEVTVDSAAEAAIEVVRFGDAPGCLDPERPLEVELSDASSRRTAAVVIVTAPEHASSAEGWSVTIDGEARPIRPPGAAARSRATLGPFAVIGSPRTIGVFGSSRADATARCPHGELHEIRLLGPEHAALADARLESVVLEPEADLGHEVAPVEWVSGRGLSRLRPMQGRAPSLKANSVGLVAGAPIAFAPEPQGIGSFDVVVNLTAARLSPSARIGVWADDVRVGQIDPPDRRDRSWQSPALTFVAAVAVTRWRLELESTDDAVVDADDVAWIRDIGLFSRAP